MRHFSSTDALILASVLATIQRRVSHGTSGLPGINHRLHGNNSGIRKRSNQTALIYGTITTVRQSARASGDQGKLATRSAARKIRASRQPLTGISHQARMHPASLP